MTYNIVCDSSSDLKSDDLQPGYLHLEVVPMRILVGGREYPDNEMLNVPLLLEEMAEDKAASGTACPSPAAFARAFEEADCSICFTISSNLSGTYNAAMLARSTAGCLVLLVQKARSLLETEEPDFEKVCEELRMYQASLRTLFTLECFDNLIKNGRMRPLVGNLLHTLGIHIIAEGTPQGTIHVAGKARGESKTYRAIVELMRESKDCSGAEVVLSHCENLSGALKLKELILRELPVKSVALLSCRGLTTFYAMEKGLIIGY